jgi:hypothetical protein
MALDLPNPVRAPHSATRMPPRPAPPPARRAVPKRPVLLAGLLGVLLVGCVLAVRSSGGGEVSPARPAAAGPAAANEPASGPAGFGVEVGDTTGCQTLAGSEPQLLCPMEGGVVEYLQVTDPAAAYRRVAGPEVAIAARGEAACASGRPEARAWARPEAPEVVAGRYVCRVFEDRAELWWTVDDANLLGHASRNDADLASLFGWWRTRSERTG